MTKTLRDPAKEPWEIFEETENGGAIRNDGTVLAPMRKNPFYVLATLAGEQTDVYRTDIAAKNRRYWNGWACAGMDEAERVRLAKEMGLEPGDLAPLSDDERQKLELAFRERLPDTDLPQPGRVDFLLEYLPVEASFSFSGYVFPGVFYSQIVNVRGRASFDSAVFLGDAFFSDTCLGSVYLQKSVSFRSVTFCGHASFGPANFCGDAVFDATKFTRSATFRPSTFRLDASFRSTVFEDNAYFDSARFQGIANFQFATFNQLAIFKYATFSFFADFSDCAFKSRTAFDRTHFNCEVPKFYQCALHQDTVFTTDRSYWPEITPENAREGERAYIRLRQLMDDLKKPDDRHFFFRQEMRCKALTEGRWDRWPITLFDWMSNYGYSIERPTFGLLAIWIGLAVAMFVETELGCLRSLISGPVACGELAVSGIARPFAFSFANLFSFFGFARLYFGDLYPQLSVGLKIAASLQTVFGWLFLFFLGLGLRNRFRLK